MSIHAQINEALSDVASGHVYPQVAPQEAPAQYVAWKRLSSDETWTIHGELVCAKSVFIFECWGETLLEALGLADEVRAAIKNSQLETFPAELTPGDEYDPPTDSSMEPVIFGFWH